MHWSKSLGKKYHCLIGSWPSAVLVLKEGFFGGKGVGSATEGSLPVESSLLEGCGD